MNKLPRGITRTFFETDCGYEKFDKRFRELARNKDPELTATHYLLAQVIRGRDWTKGIGRMTNRIKIANGGLYNWQAQKALDEIHLLSGVVVNLRRIEAGQAYASTMYHNALKDRVGRVLKLFGEVLTPDALVNVAVLLPRKILVDAPKEITSPYVDVTLVGGQVWG